jgi:hypothetical protein
MKEKLSRPVFQQVKLVWVWSDCFVVSSSIRRPQYQTRLVCHDQVPLTHSLPNFASLSLILFSKILYSCLLLGKVLAQTHPLPAGAGQRHTPHRHTMPFCFFLPPPLPPFSSSLVTSTQTTRHTPGGKQLFLPRYLYIPKEKKVIVNM